MDWSEEQISRLRELWTEGHSSAEIGRRIGVSKNAIVGKVHRLDLPARPSPIKAYDPSSPRPSRAKRAPRVTLPPLPPMPRPVTVATSPLSAPVRTVPQPAPAAFEPESVTLSTTLTCQFITNDRKPYQFCGAPAIVGKAWCPECIKRIYHKSARQEAA